MSKYTLSDVLYCIRQKKGGKKSATPSPFPLQTAGRLGTAIDLQLFRNYSMSKPCKCYKHFQNLCRELC